MKITKQNRKASLLMPIILVVIIAVSTFIAIALFAGNDCEQNNSGNLGNRSSTNIHSGSLSEITDFLWLPLSGIMSLDIGNAEMIHGLVSHDGLLYYLYVEYSENPITMNLADRPHSWEPYIASFRIKGIDEIGVVVYEITVPATTIHFDVIGFNVNYYTEFSIITHEYIYGSEESGLYYARYDINGNMLSREALFLSDGLWTPQKAFFGDSDVVAIYGFDYWGSSKTFVWDADFSPLAEIPTLRRVGALTRDGTFLHIAYSNGFVLRETNYRTGERINEISFPLYAETSSIHLSSDSSDYDIYIITRQYLYGFIIESEELVPVLDFLESHINLTARYNIAFHSEAIAITQEIPSLETHTTSVEIAILSAVHRSAFEYRDYIVLAGFRLSPVFIGRVTDFNRRNPDLYVVVHDYWDASDMYGFGQAIERFHLDIIAGNIPDIIVFDEPEAIDLIRTRDALIRQGILLDLYSMIDADPMLNRDDFFQNILQGLEDGNGTLPVIGNQLAITTMVTSNSSLQMENWDVNSFLALMEHEISVGNVEPLGNRITGVRFLTTMIEYMGDYFVDRENGVGNFESDSFIRLLNIAANIPTNSFYSDWPIDFSPNQRALYTSEQAVDLVAFAGLSGWVINAFYEVAPEDFRFIGFPGLTDGVHHVQLSSTFSIFANSPNQDDAWQFVREALLPNATERIALSLRVNEFEDRLVASPLSTNEMSVIRDIVRQSTAQNSLSDMILMIVEEGFSAFYNGSSDAESVARIIQNRVSIYLSEQS